jgi:hypothetical protein
MQRFAFFLCFFPLTLFAQPRRNQNSSIAAGNLYLAAGMNKAWYTGSTLGIQGAGYAFDLKGFKGFDAPSWNFSDMQTVQYNARIGYYFRYGLNLSVGFDHMRYLVQPPHSVLLTGKVNAGVDNATGLSGDYSFHEVVMDSLFQWSCPGLNFINVRFTKTDRLIGSMRSDRFLLSSDMGLAAGALMTNSDFIFGGNKDKGVTSLSGVGLSAYGALRFEFFEHIFLQTGFNAGVLRQMRMRLRQADPNAVLKQTVGFFQPEIMLGAVFKIKMFNDCNSCPVWK